MKDPEERCVKPQIPLRSRECPFAVVLRVASKGAADDADDDLRASLSLFLSLTEESLEIHRPHRPPSPRLPSPGRSAKTIRSAT